MDPQFERIAGHAGLTAEDLSRYDEALFCEAEGHAVTPMMQAPRSMDYQWFELPPEEFIMLLEVCVSGRGRET